MPLTTRISFHSRFHRGPVDSRIFGGFLEHMGRAVYEGVYQPDSPRADENGNRADVLAELATLQMTAMRYPGGNFASGYHWQDGIGPRPARPVVRELAWNSIETNQFGTEEFLAMCQQMGWTPMLTVNLGTGTPEEARNWVEYCNAPAGTRYADMRPGPPHNVKLWCLGNEMDGPWQLGHVPAEQYAIRAQQAAKMMKDVDPDLELVACGTCSPALDTYLQWDRTVLEHLGAYADYISLHRYVKNEENDPANFLAVTNSIDQQIEEMDAVCRYVQGRHRSKKRAYLCFDEWNVWYKNMEMDGRGKRAPHLIEEIYNLEDALVVAGFFNSFIRHADVLKIANIAQIVNIIAPIQTRDDDLLVQSIFYPFAMMSARREGNSLQLDIDGPGYESQAYGKAAYIDASAIHGAGIVHLFLTNRHLTEAMTVRVEMLDGALTALLNGELLTGTDVKAANSWENKEVIRPIPFSEAHFDAGLLEVTLPATSFTALTISVDR